MVHLDPLVPKPSPLKELHMDPLIAMPPPRGEYLLPKTENRNGWVSTTCSTDIAADPENESRTDGVTESNCDDTDTSTTDEGEHELQANGVAELSWDTDTSTTDGRECKPLTDEATKLKCNTDTSSTHQRECKPQTDGVTESKCDTDTSSTDQRECKPQTDGVAELKCDTDTSSTDTSSTDTSSTDQRECKPQTDGVAESKCDTDTSSTDGRQCKPQTDGVAELKCDTDTSTTDESILRNCRGQTIEDSQCNDNFRRCSSRKRKKPTFYGMPTNDRNSLQLGKNITQDGNVSVKTCPQYTILSKYLIFSCLFLPKMIKLVCKTVNNNNEISYHTFPFLKSLSIEFISNITLPYLLSCEQHAQNFQCESDFCVLMLSLLYLQVIVLKGDKVGVGSLHAASYHACSHMPCYNA